MKKGRLLWRREDSGNRCGVATFRAIQDMDETETKISWASLLPTLSFLSFKSIVSFLCAALFRPIYRWRCVRKRWNVQYAYHLSPVRERLSNLITSVLEFASPSCDFAVGKYGCLRSPLTFWFLSTSMRAPCRCSSRCRKQARDFQHMTERSSDPLDDGSTSLMRWHLTLNSRT